MSVPIEPWEDQIRRLYLSVSGPLEEVRSEQRNDLRNVLELLEAASRDIEAHCRLNPDRTGGPIMELLCGPAPFGWLNESIEWLREKIDRENGEAGFEKY